MQPRNDKSLIFYSENDRQLFGVIHYPTGVRKKTGFLYCHPFGEEKNLAHRISINVARNIAGMGYPVMRFDFSGCGDSDGELNEFTIDDWVADISAAEKYFTNLLDLEQCLLWGLRFGAYLALQNALKHTTISGLILWQPILDPQVYIHQFLRQRLSSQIVVGNPQRSYLSTLINQLHNDRLINVMGYPISLKLYESFLKKPTIYRDSINNLPILTLSISLLNAVSPPILTFIDHLRNSNNKVVFERLNEESFWDRPWRYHCPITEQVTIDWILDNL